MTETRHGTDPDPDLPSDRDLVLLRQTLDLAARARSRGNHPFGALIASPEGEVLLTAENTVVSEHDVTGHAETNLVRVASRILPWGGLGDHTLYTSCEPCAMCAGAIYWLGVGRVVFALAESQLRELIGDHPENPTLAVPARSVFAAGQRPTAVLGPLLRDEAIAPHRGFWR